jgi:hypothetical protein
LYLRSPLRSSTLQPYLMKKNFEHSAIINKKISSIPSSRVEMFKFLIGMLLIGHLVANAHLHLQQLPKVD